MSSVTQISYKDMFVILYAENCCWQTKICCQRLVDDLLTDCFTLVDDLLTACWQNVLRLLTACWRPVDRFFTLVNGLLTDCFTLDDGLLKAINLIDDIRKLSQVKMDLSSLILNHKWNCLDFYYKLNLFIRFQLCFKVETE